MKSLIHALSAVLLLSLAACGEDVVTAEAPAPEEMTRDAIGHYCNMIVADHPGPKAQLHLKDASAPVWFSSVRDAVAFTLLPEEPKAITAIYVNDMAKAMNWDSPEPGTWIAARDAWYVIESDRRGGMGAPETVPFSDRDAASRFAAKHGGRLVRWEEIPADYVLAPVDEPASHQTSHHQGHGEQQ